MFRSESLKSSIEMIRVELMEFCQIIEDVIFKASDNTLISIKSLIFKTKLEIPDEEFTLKDLARNGISIFDYYIYFSLVKTHKDSIVWIIDGNLRQFNEDDYAKGIFTVFFLLITRAKLRLNENEKMPKFITSYLDFKLGVQEFNDIVSRNNISNFDHSWVLKIDLSKLSKPVIQRLESGIAGCRKFNIFKTLKPKNYDKLSDNLKISYDTIRKIAEDGPFSEMHPFGMTLSLKSSSISRNLDNMIIDIYTEDEINSMINSGILFTKPKYDQRYVQYKNYDKNFKNHFRNPLFKKFEQDQSNL